MTVTTAAARLLVPATLAIFLILAAEAESATVRVAAGGDLQQALTNARPGDTIQLDAGATFTGNFTLPQKDGSTDVIVLRTNVGTNEPDGRVSPGGGFAILRSPNGAPALQIAPGGHHWRVELVEITGSGDGNLVELGSGSQTSAQVPHDLVIDRAYIHGDATKGVRRCVALNSASTVVSNSYISDCKAIGADAQAIAGWNGPGPFHILNNYLEGSTENILFGGGDPSIQDLVPTDITIRGNDIAKPPAWRNEPWQVKNLLELKNAKNVVIDHNVLSYNWQAAQQGFAVLFTVRNQDGGCPWCTVEQVTFVNNFLRHSAAGIQILGTDDQHPSKQTQKVTIRNNVLSDINPQEWGGNGYAFLFVGGPREITIDHNTIIQSNASGVIQADGPPVMDFTFTNNLAQAGAYGIIGTDHGPGNDTISTYFPASLIAGNVIAGADSGRFPSKNQYPSVGDFLKQFVGYGDGNYSLVPASSWHGAGTDGGDIGASRTLLAQPPIDGRKPVKRQKIGNQNGAS
jgi:Right handed beta helix region